MAEPYEHYFEMKDRGIDLADYGPEPDWHMAFCVRLIGIVMESAHPDALLAASGVSQSTFENWARGSASPCAFKVAKIASYLDVSLDWLMLGERFDKFIMTEGCDD